MLFKETMWESISYKKIQQEPLWIISYLISKSNTLFSLLIRSQIKFKMVPVVFSQVSIYYQGKSEAKSPQKANENQTHIRIYILI